VEGSSGKNGPGAKPPDTRDPDLRSPAAKNAPGEVCAIMPQKHFKGFLVDGQVVFFFRGSAQTKCPYTQGTLLREGAWGCHISQRGGLLSRGEMPVNATPARKRCNLTPPPTHIFL